jgi:HEAT repeat protein
MMKTKVMMLVGLATAGLGVELSEGERERCLEVLRGGLAAHEEWFWPAMHAAEALTLAGYGEEVKPVLRPLLAEEEDAQKRCGLARELARAGEREKLSVLVGVLRGEDEYGHVHAAESLFKLGWCEEVDWLRTFLKPEGNRRLGIMVAAAMAKGGHAEGLSYLRSTLAVEQDPNVFFLAAWALGQVGGEADGEGIRRRLEDAPDAWIASFLQHALARLGDAVGRAALLENLRAEDARLRTYAAEAAGAIPLPEARGRLLEQLGDADLDARIRAAQSLLVMGAS